MANIRLKFDNAELRNLMSGSGMQSFLMETGQKVATELISTAVVADNGPGGTISDYSDSGFSVIYERRTRRPRVIVKSNARGESAMAAQFHYFNKTGQLHMLAALYKYVSRRR